MTVEILILLVIFVGLLVLNTPVAVCIGLSAAATIVSLGDASGGYVLAQRISAGIASFPLLAIPFFVLAGVLMGEGGMARRLTNFAAVLVGRLPGGLAYVNTVTCMLFGSVSGSATAAGFLCWQFTHSRNGGQGIQARIRRGPDRHIGDHRSAHSS